MDVSDSQRYVLFNERTFRVIVGLINARPFIKPLEDFTHDDAGTWTYCQMLREYFLWGNDDTTTPEKEECSEWEIVPQESVVAIQEMMSL